MQLYTVTAIELQLDNGNSEQDINIISGTAGTMSFLLIIGIILVIVCVRKSSNIAKKEFQSDL